MSESKKQHKKQSAAKIVASKLLRKSRQISATARVLGLSRKVVARSINSQESRKPRSDKLSEEDASLVHNFYIEQASRPMPNKRDVLLIRDKYGEKKENVQKHFMEMTQDAAYQKFKEENPTVKIKKRKFDTLKPIQERKTNISNRKVCCCTYIVL